MFLREKKVFFATQYFGEFYNSLRISHAGDQLAYGGDTLAVTLEPSKIYMSCNSGRVYHPAPERFGGIGLIRSKLAIEFSKHFEFTIDDNGGDELRPPVLFRWNGHEYKLDKEWVNGCQVQIKPFN